MTRADIFVNTVTAATKGRRLRSYDYRTGRMKKMTVEGCRLTARHVCFSGDDGHGRKVRIYVIRRYVANLVMAGTAEHNRRAAAQGWKWVLN